MEAKQAKPWNKGEVTVRYFNAEEQGKLNEKVYYNIYRIKITENMLILTDSDEWTYGISLDVLVDWATDDKIFVEVG